MQTAAKPDDSFSQLGYDFYFHQRTLGQRGDFNAASRRPVGEKPGIYFVERGEIRHVLKEARCFDRFFKAAARRLQNRGEVQDSLPGLPFDAGFLDLTGTRIDPDLAGGKYEAVDCDRLGIRADGVRRAFC